MDVRPGTAKCQGRIQDLEKDGDGIERGDIFRTDVTPDVKRKSILVRVRLGDGEVDGFSLVQARGSDVLHEGRRAPPTSVEDERKRTA